MVRTCNENIVRRLSTVSDALPGNILVEISSKSLVQLKTCLEKRLCCCRNKLTGINVYHQIQLYVLSQPSSAWSSVGTRQHCRAGLGLLIHSVSISIIPPPTWRVLKFVFQTVKNFKRYFTEMCRNRRNRLYCKGDSV